jgi:hypothetical protein
VLPHTAIANPDLIQALIRATIEEPVVEASIQMKDHEPNEETKNLPEGVELQPEV